jgi:hypothetical protein
MVRKASSSRIASPFHPTVGVMRGYAIHREELGSNACVGVASQRSNLLGQRMPRAEFYREQARRLISMARTSRYPDLAVELEAQARLYLVLARLRENPPSDLSPLLNEFNARQIARFRQLSDEVQAATLPEHLVRLLAQLEHAVSRKGGARGSDNDPITRNS